MGKLRHGSGLKHRAGSGSLGTSGEMVASTHGEDGPSVVEEQLHGPCVPAGSTGGHTAPHGQGDMGLFHEEMGDIGGSVSSRLEERGPYMLW